MTGEPGDDELVAIVAAYVLVARERRPLAPVPTSPSGWRLAMRAGGDDVAPVRPGRRRSRWRDAAGP